MVVPGEVLAQDIEKEDEDRSSRRYRTHSFVNFEFGLNNYLLADGKFPDAIDAPFTVKPLESKTLALNFVNNSQIAGPVFADWGGGLSLLTYKFEDPMVRLIKDTDGITFPQDANGYSSYKKSKLNITYINAFVVPMIYTSYRGRMVDKENSFRFGAGLFGSYRVGSSMKVVYNDEKKQKDKIKSNFFLNNIQYGIRAQVGWKGTDIYFNYNLSTLFQEDRGPELYPIGFGIIF